MWQKQKGVWGGTNLNLHGKHHKTGWRMSRKQCNSVKRFSEIITQQGTVTNGGMAGGVYRTDGRNTACREVGKVVSTLDKSKIISLVM